MELPNYLWGEAVRHTTYLINRAATRVIKSSTPYELYKGRNPRIGHLRIFGCIAYAKIESQHLKKLDNRSQMLVHLGTEPGSKAYQLFEQINKKVVVSRDAIFDENRGWDWKTCNKEEETGAFRVSISQFENHGIDNIDTNTTDSEEEDLTEATYVGTLNQEEDQDNVDEVEPELRRSQRESKRPSYLDDYILPAELEGEHLLLSMNDEPWSFEEAKEKKVWRDACEDEIKSIVKNKTWELVEFPAEAKATGLKWIFKIKRNYDGSINKFKARLVEKGYIQ